jgi:alpha-L-rhamnosidase
LRKEFFVSKPIKKARAYATAHGCYRLKLNGKRVGNIELAPEATPYHQYLQYQTYDVADLLHAGENTFGAVLADGWWSSRIGNDGCSRQFGDKLALLAQIEIEYDDGEKETIYTDETFKSWDNGPLRFSDLYMGEKYDAQMECDGWDEHGYDDNRWQSVTEKNFDMSVLVGQNAEPMRAKQVLKPEKIYISPKGETIVDFGQVMTGNVKITFSGEKGKTAVISYTEQTDKDGNYDLSIMGRNNQHRDYYVFKSNAEETYEPSFTFRGFRYIRIENYCGSLKPDNIEARLICSDMEITGTFECSDERLTKLQNNIKWSLLGNMLSIPMDNPDRERAGWTGDAGMIATTACFNLGMQAFWKRWLEEMRLEQREKGNIPMIIPFWKGYGIGTQSAAGWGDVCVLLPWASYCFYGDERILADNYEMMQKWIEFVRRTAESSNPDDIGELDFEHEQRLKYIWNNSFQFGDWLTPSATFDPEREEFSYTEMPLAEYTPSFYYALSTGLMSKIAKILNKPSDAAYYENLNKTVVQASTEEFYHSGAIMNSPFQGYSVLALQAGFVPKNNVEDVKSRLLELIHKNDGKMDTGFTSTQFLFDVLVRHGETKTAFDLLFQNKIPSWLYEIESGATGIWESWMAILPGGKINPVSFIQYANGCIGDWMYRMIGGIDLTENGCSRIKMAPQMDERISSAKAELNSVKGIILSEWKMEEEKFKYSIKVPVNAIAEVHLPQANAENILESGKPLAKQDGILSVNQGEQEVVVEIGSGTYEFVYKFLEQ